MTKPRQPASDVSSLEIDEAVALVGETDFSALPELAAAFAAHPAFQVKLQLANTLPLREFPAVARSLAFGEDSLVANAIVEHVDLGDFPDIARDLCTSVYSSVRQAVARKLPQHLFPEVLEVFLENDDVLELTALASAVSASSPQSLVARLCADLREEVRGALAAVIPFEAFPRETHALAHDKAPEIPEILAGRVRSGGATHPTPVLWAMLKARQILATPAAHALATHHPLSDKQWAVLVSRKDFEPTLAARNPHTTEEQRAGITMFGIN